MAYKHPTCQNCWRDDLIGRFHDKLSRSELGKKFSEYMGYVQLECDLAKGIVKDLHIFNKMFPDIDVDSFYTLFSRLLLPLGGSMDHTRSGDENGKTILRNLIFAACPNIINKDKSNDTFQCQDVQFKVHVSCHLSLQQSQISINQRRQERRIVLVCVFLA